VTSLAGVSVDDARRIPVESFALSTSCPTCVSRPRGATGRRIAIAALLFALPAFLLGFRGPLFQGNSGVVEAGGVYRSAQPTGRLAEYQRQVGIRSVLNLRGGSLDDPFYAEEVRETSRLKLDFYDFPMSATRRPSRRELLVILDFFERCRYPLLIHCKSGSDRTGLASALYLLYRRGQSPDQALAQFSLAYAHVPLFGPQHLHEPIDEYRVWLRERSLDHSPRRFLDWVKYMYRDDKPGPEMRPLQPGPRAMIAVRVAR
jgi:hypothetical protein